MSIMYNMGEDIIILIRVAAKHLNKDTDWRIIMGNSKKYKNCFVIFIDMLGTQDKKDIDSIYSDYSTFHSMILSKDGKYITDGRNGGITSGEKIRMYAHTFSDCAYMLYMYDNESLNSDSDKGMLIENALCHFERIVLKLLQEAIVFRGGASYGEVFYEKEKNILFGPAINEAFQLEDKQAKSPRILVSANVANIYNDYFQQCVEKLDNPCNDYEKCIQKILQLEGIGNLKENQGRLVVKDNSDGKYFVNYLNSVKKVCYVELPEISTYSMTFKEAFLSFAQEKSIEAGLNNNLRVKEKYDWLIKYIQS